MDLKVFLVAGARPNFMKIAPIFRAAQKFSQIDCQVVHTGQHYDHEMSQTFLDELELPRPHFFLNGGSGSHAVQTAKIMIAFEEICQHEKPDLVIVVGDVNSTLACSVVAKKFLVKVAHVEAGLRSFDLSMPEEINRMVTDSISDYFFVTEDSGLKNLIREGKSEACIHLVGNVMIDNLFYQARKIGKGNGSDFSTFELKQRMNDYVFLTLHRPSNVDSESTFQGIASALNEIAGEKPIIFPAHPRTRKMIEQFDIKLSEDIHVLPPLGFMDALFLWKDASVVMTDSGGLQEETTAMGVPCLTLRDNTERPITIEMGTNILAGTNRKSIMNAYRESVKRGSSNYKVPPKWDGRAAERIWKILCEQFPGI